MSAELTETSTIPFPSPNTSPTQDTDSKKQLKPRVKSYTTSRGFLTRSGPTRNVNVSNFILTWFETLLNSEFESEACLEELKNGVILCKLLRKTNSSLNHMYFYEPESEIEEEHNVSIFIFEALINYIQPVFKYEDLKNGLNSKNIFSCIKNFAENAKKDSRGAFLEAFEQITPNSTKGTPQMSLLSPSPRSSPRSSANLSGVQESDLTLFKQLCQKFSIREVALNGQSLLQMSVLIDHFKLFSLLLHNPESLCLLGNRDVHGQNILHHVTLKMSESKTDRTTQSGNDKQNFPKLTIQEFRSKLRFLSELINHPLFSENQRDNSEREKDETKEKLVDSNEGEENIELSGSKDKHPPLYSSQEVTIKGEEREPELQTQNNEEKSSDKNQKINKPQKQRFEESINEILSFQSEYNSVFDSAISLMKSSLSFMYSANCSLALATTTDNEGNLPLHYFVSFSPPSPTTLSLSSQLKSPPIHSSSTITNNFQTLNPSPFSTPTSSRPLGPIRSVSSSVLQTTFSSVSKPRSKSPSRQMREKSPNTSSNPNSKSPVYQPSLPSSFSSSSQNSSDQVKRVRGFRRSSHVEDEQTKMDVDADLSKLLIQNGSSSESSSEEEEEEEEEEKENHETEHGGLGEKEDRSKIKKKKKKSKSHKKSRSHDKLKKKISKHIQEQSNSSSGNSLSIRSSNSSNLKKSLEEHESTIEEYKKLLKKLISITTRPKRVGHILNMSNNKGDTLLHLCIYHNNVQAFDILLEYSEIDIDLVNGQGESGLHVALSHYNKNPHFFKSLISKGADTHISSPSHGTLQSLAQKLNISLESIINPNESNSSSTNLSLVGANQVVWQSIRSPRDSSSDTNNLNKSSTKSNSNLSNRSNISLGKSRKMSLGGQLVGTGFNLYHNNFDEVLPENNFNQNESPLTLAASRSKKNQSSISPSPSPTIKEKSDLDEGSSFLLNLNLVKGATTGRNTKRKNNQQRSHLHILSPFGLLNSGVNNVEPNKLEVESQSIDTQVLFNSEPTFTPGVKSEHEEITRRQHVIKELASTEEIFVVDLSSALSTYNTGLELGNLLMDLESVKEFHSSLLLPAIIEVEGMYCGSNSQDSPIQASNDPLQSWKNLFHQVKKMQPLYEKYCISMDMVHDELNNMMKNKRFSQKHNTIRLMNKELKQLTLQDFLAKPNQRLCKYPLLFRELLKYTEEDDESYQLLDQIKATFEEILSSINAKKADLENKRRLLEIQTSIVGSVSIDLVRDHRRLLREGYVDKLEKGEMKAYYVFLFNDTIIFTIRKKRFHFEFAGVLTLESVVVADIDEKRIKLTRSTGRYLQEILSVDPALKTAWLRDFQTAISESTRDHVDSLTHLRDSCKGASFHSLERQACIQGLEAILPLSQTRIWKGEEDLGLLTKGKIKFRRAFLFDDYLIFAEKSIEISPLTQSQSIVASDSLEELPMSGEIRQTNQISKIVRPRLTNMFCRESYYFKTAIKISGLTMREFASQSSRLLELSNLNTPGLTHVVVFNEGIRNGLYQKLLELPRQRRKSLFVVGS